MDKMKQPTMMGWLSAPKSKTQIDRNKAVAQAARKSQKRSKNNSMRQAYQAASKENLSNGQWKKKKNKAKPKQKKRASWDESSSSEEDFDEIDPAASESEESFVEDDDESEDDDEVSYAEDSELDQVDEVESEDDDDEEEEEEVLSPSPTPNKRKNNKKKPTKRTTKKSILDDDESDDQVLYAEDDSDQEPDQVDEVESEDEEELVSPSPTPNKNKKKKLRLDDSDDSEAGFLSPSNFTMRKSKPSAALKRASQAATNRYNPPIAFDKKNAKISPAATKTAKRKQNISDSDDNDDDSLFKTPPLQNKKSSSKYFERQTNSTTNQESSKPSKRAFDHDSTNKEDNFLPSKRQRSSMDSLGTTTATKNSNNNNNTTSEDDAWLDDSPMSSLLKKDKKKKKKLKQKQSKSMIGQNPFAQFANSDIGDEDEQIAMAMALSASMKDAKQNTTTTALNQDASSSTTATTVKKKEKKKIKTIDISDDENEPIFKEDEEDEEESEQEDDANDDVYDEEKEAATNVLQTAEGLSARVLQTMKTWMSSTKDENEDAHKGMIIEDGALALGGMNGDDNSQNSKEWISQEYMQQLLPEVKLSKYQLIGVNWMALLHTMECKMNNCKKSKTTNVNGILADEMGLGKTVQTIAFLAYLKELQQDERRPHLIVVPVSVLPNWVREFEKFAPEMNVVKYHGSMAERRELQNDLRRYLPKKKDGTVRNKKWSKQLKHDDDDSDDGPAQLDVILAPVTYFQKEKSDDRKFLNKFQFDYLVVDEAHMLKNSASTRYKMLDRIGTRHRLLLTGTPIQNSPQELLNMLCFIMPLFSQGGSSGSSSYEDEDGGNKASFSERMLQHFVEHETMEEGGDEEKAYQKLKRLFAPFVLRRKKSDVIAQLLPPKERVVEYVELDMEARGIYEGILAAHVNKNGSKVSAAIGDHLFTNLRKAAHHPLLLRTRHTSDREINHMTECFHKYGAFKGEGSTRARVKEELSKFNDFHIHLTALELIDENPRRRGDLERYILPEQALFSSAKFSRLQALLPSLISNGHRILIFSVWTSCLDLLGCLMEHLNLEYLRMDGSCPSAERQELIDRFNQDPSISIFLLSTKACGLGINLTAADTCIIHDLDFNPFNDLQAEDRCHRIGQKKKVTVYKMVTKETVDADIYNMQERKAKMNAAIMESKNDKKERREMLNQEIQRFLGSPKAEKSSKKIGDVDFI